jgi:hexosaminidase
MKIIPQPEKITALKGSFSINNKTRIKLTATDSNTKFISDYLQKNLLKMININLSIDPGVEKDYISFQMINRNLGPEDYILEIKPDQITINAGASAGLFYGVQTLLQIVFQSKEHQGSTVKLSCCRIEDRPRFSWRGMHLDVSRHFFSKEFIRKYIDLLALHKMNKFHWHLTDDNGWRIEIKKYPLLTEIGAWRKDLEHLPWNERDDSDDPGKGLYGGYYTQEDIVEIVEYARQRFIEIIPEIEMPGHSREVFAAYPQFSCKDKKLTVAPGGYWPNLDIFCAGKDETFHFLSEILQEVAQLFPSKYIHVGGDEANKTNWRNCTECQKRISDESLADEAELQSWFIGRISDFLKSIGKQLIGWDEILEGDLNTKATVMCWRGNGVDAAIKAASKDLDMVMCPNKVLYFDWKQNSDDIGAFGVTTLEQVYSYDPIPEVLTADQRYLILGAQGNTWTEWMEENRKVEYMVIPRICALSEIIWTAGNNKDFQEFRARLGEFLKLIEFYGFQYNEFF